MENLANIVGDKYTESNEDDERNGIDGYIGSIPISLKPTSFNRSRYSSPVNDNLIYYEINGDNISYTFTFEPPEEWRDAITQSAPNMILETSEMECC